MPADPGAAETTNARELSGLTQAFESFTEATRRLEREYAALRTRVGELAVELEVKNRRLATPPLAGELAGLTVREMERRLIIETLERTHDNRTQAAKLLGISIRTLRNKLAEYRGRARGLPACEPGN